MRWCSFCATEFPEGTPMKIARGGVNICVPCSQTERGRRECQEFNTTEGYRPTQRARAGKWARIREAMGKPGYTRKRRLMTLNLPSLDAAVHTLRPNAKPVRRKTIKGRKDRAEAKVKKIVRAQCVERDGACSVERAFFGHRGYPFDLNDEAVDISGYESCGGASQWAHMHTKRRSKTRNMAPEVRHTTAASLMLCRLHHDEYDGRQKPRLFITALTRKGADGPLKFRRAK